MEIKETSQQSTDIQQVLSRASEMGRFIFCSMDLGNGKQQNVSF
jgi:hypothetical protein